ncbi:hypothetical protein CJ030_MR8G008701 [Morella rubra]|uniref:Uncharacterized protein n=1 Tax=Morella rubra TaxID=262757 RepID=A0A6A1UPZ3_9ROSI|nr:hypothetical protein CJ030_MR8G008701 [Morella rubra]
MIHRLQSIIPPETTLIAYESSIVIKNFARTHLGYLNLSRLAWRFYDKDVGEISYIESDDDCWNLIETVRKDNVKELHIYIEHSMDDPIFKNDEINDCARTDGVGGGALYDDGPADSYDIGGVKDDGGADHGVGGDNVGIGEDEQEPVIFSDFEDSEPKGPKLYNTVENQEEAAKARENVMSLFGSAA